MRKDQNKFSNEELGLEELNFIDQMLKESLEDDLDVSIPHDFADQVTEVIEKRKSIKEALLKHFMMSLGLTTILAFAVGILFYLGKDEAYMLIDFIAKFKYPIAFALFTLLSIQVADSLLLSRTKEQLEK